MRIGRDRGKDDRQDVVYGITDAQKPLSQDIRSRESKYLMAMGIRVVAFLLIVILPIAWPWKIGLAVLALALPYIAVVYANGGREPERGADSWYQDPSRRMLLPGPGGTGGPEKEDTEPDKPAEPIVGRIVDDD
ncbi:MAG: DUF3099 domain-containing protein [Catenulispora sp.]